ncbi:hypothetical protein CAEBREN_20500 [Caenorhabditis brenneri]|uniref:RING-type domain-containing protein n=1 Tax=Caenorhabditis brenneri TaxID=135651 RepID=G0N3R0_CAEBE|nr:hypothetical protein CAEBREN_20500 [Caenorhabditis brenneri]
MTSLECKVCLQEYSNQVEDLTPRMLTCGHTICEKCAEQILDGEEVACPFDRKITNVDGGEIKSLSKNYTLLEILEERQSVEVSDDERPDELSVDSSDDEVEVEKKEVKIPCSENSDHTAVFYCEECESDLCDEKQFFQEPVCQGKEKAMCKQCLLSGEHDSHEKRDYELLRLQRTADVQKALDRVQLVMAQLIQEITDSHDRTESYDKTGPIFQRCSSAISDEFNEKRTAALRKLDLLCDSQRNYLVELKTLLEEDTRSKNEMKENLYRDLRMNVFNLSNYKAVQEFDFTDFHFEGLSSLRTHIHGNRLFQTKT